MTKTQQCPLREYEYKPFAAITAVRVCLDRNSAPCMGLRTQASDLPIVASNFHTTWPGRGNSIDPVAYALMPFTIWHVMLIDGSMCALEAYAAVAIRVTSDICVDMFDLGVDRLLQIAALYATAYSSLLLFSLTMVGLLCDATVNMSMMEWLCRLLLTSGCVIAIGHLILTQDLSIVLFKSTTLSHAISAALGGFCGSFLYLFDVDPIGMSWSDFLFFPLTCAVQVLKTSMYEFTRSVPLVASVFKLAAAVLVVYLRFNVGHIDARVDTAGVPSMLGVLSGYLYITIGFNPVTMFIHCLSILIRAPVTYLVCRRSFLAFVAACVSIIFASLRSTIIYLLVLGTLCYLDNESLLVPTPHHFDPHAVLGDWYLLHRATTVCSPIEPWMLKALLIIATTVFFIQAMRTVAVIVLRQVLSRTLSPENVCAVTDQLPFAARVLKALDNPKNHKICSLVVPSGGGKSTQAALLSVERSLQTGLVGIDKDAVLSAAGGMRSVDADRFTSAAVSMQATDTEEQADEDEDGQDMRRNDEAVESVVNATRAYIDRRISEIQKLTDGTPGGTNILVMLHRGHEVVTYGLPIYGFCGAVVPSDGQIATVVRERSASVEEGGWGIPVELMKARISADLAAARRLPRATWPAQAKFGITGAPTNVDYLQIPTLSGLRPYTVPSSCTRIDGGKFDVRVTVMGQAFP